LAPIRNALTGFVFQAYHLVPSLNALENVMFPAELRGDESAREKARRLLERVGLWNRRYNFPQQLSGGEKQRVALCRALINTPRLLFADEPTGNLDSENSRAIIELLLELQRENQITLVMATHSREMAARADRTLRIHDGRLVEGGREL
jgi:putative ABC transport system ATP-binding protein